MTSRDPRLYLQDILDSINRIEKYTSRLTFVNFCRNQLIIDAVVRNFEIIGEAARCVPAKFRASHKEIPWNLMIGMRNKMIHEYIGVDYEILWKTISHSLPDLKNKLKKLKF